MALDAVMSLDDLQMTYLSGSMSDQEAMDVGILDEHGALPAGSTFSSSGRNRPVTCRCCATKGLKWGKQKGKWRLVDSKGDLHQCPVNPLNE